MQRRAGRVAARANDELRNQLVPINRKHPIEELLAAAGTTSTGRTDAASRSNTSCSTASMTSRSTQERWPGAPGRPAKLNLIPFNVFPGTRYRSSPARTILEFRDILNDHGVIATTRRTRGDDIDAACGQLAAR